MTLFDELEAAKNKVAQIEREIAIGPCREFGHDWQSVGGCNAGCHDDCVCSIPVNTCSKCGDCDYGDNAHAIETRKACAEEWGDPLERFSAAPTDPTEGDAK